MASSMGIVVMHNKAFKERLHEFLIYPIAVPLIAATQVWVLIEH